MRVGVGIGLYGFWECGLGVWGGTGWVRGLVGQVLGLDGLCWGMWAWDMGLEGGILVAVVRFWALAGFMGTGHKKNAEIVGGQTEQKK